MAPVKPRMLVISNVLPFPLSAGQNQRVFYKLRAFRELFEITFLTSAPDDVHKELLTHCDNAIVLPTRYDGKPGSKVRYRTLGAFYTLRTGLKLSNYLVGRVEYSVPRLTSALENVDFDCVLYEYWHAWESLPLFQDRGIPCVLDMHNILWQSYSNQLRAQRTVPGVWKRWAISHYREREEAAWKEFDALIAINQAEYDYTRQAIGEDKPIFYAPMGTDLEIWPYCWSPVDPPRIAYYGGLGSSHNQRDALYCYEKIMPHIWREIPDAELWLVGSNPPPHIKELPEVDSRLHVTGFVQEVQEVLKTMSLVLCPWSGTYGFRSRLVEVMALGVPVVASHDAVYGMGMQAGKGILLEDGYERMAHTCIKLMSDNNSTQQQSNLARKQIEEKFGFDVTYGRLSKELYNFIVPQENASS